MDDRSELDRLRSRPHHHHDLASSRHRRPSVVVLISLVILLSLSYTFALFVMSRRRRPPLGRPGDDLWFVFLVPCLNEELVIGRSLDRLLALPNPNFAVLVIDDGSDDATADIVESYDDPRVLLLRRSAPNARQGKGQRLTAPSPHFPRRPSSADQPPQAWAGAVPDRAGRSGP